MRNRLRVLMNDQDIADLVKFYLAGRYTPAEAAEFLVPETGVDLRSVPREEWRRHLEKAVFFPPDVERYVAGQKEFSEMECEALEKRISLFHGISDPYIIVFETTPEPTAWLRYKPRWV